MKPWASSFSYRLLFPAWTWLGRAARESLVGRAVLAVGRAAPRAGSASSVLRASSIASYSLAEIARAAPRKDFPATLSVCARVYAYLTRALGEGLVGKALRTLVAFARASRFAGGRWAQVMGAGVFGLCASLAVRLAAASGGQPPPHPDLADTASRTWQGDVSALALLALAGLLTAIAGPRLLPAWRRNSETYPEAQSCPQAHKQVLKRTQVLRILPLWGAATLAMVAGILLGQIADITALYVVAGFVALGAAVLVLARPAVVLVAVAAFPWLDWMARKSLGGLGAGWDEALILACILLLLWAVLVLRSWDLWTVPVMLPLLCALAAAIGSVVVRQVPTDVGLYALRVLFQPLIFYFIGFLFPKSRLWVQAAIAVFLLSATALALHGLYQYATHAPMPAKWVDVREVYIGTRAYSIVENPNGLGAFLIMGVLVSLSLALASNLRPLLRLAAAASAVVQVAGVAVTFSRGAWLGLMAGVVALLVMACRRYLVALLGAAVVGWFLVPQSFVERLAFAFSRAYIAKSMVAGRLYAWRLALSHVTDHPWFGLGLGTFGGTTAVTFAYGRLWVDNFYLQLAAEGGLILLFCFLWLLLRNARALVRGYEVARDPFTRALTAGVFAACLAVAVANFTASVWETLVVGVGFWFLAGLATSSALHEEVGSR